MTRCDLRPASGDLAHGDDTNILRLLVSTVDARAKNLSSVQCPLQQRVRAEQSRSQLQLPKDVESSLLEQKS